MYRKVHESKLSASALQGPFALFFPSPVARTPHGHLVAFYLVARLFPHPRGVFGAKAHDLEPLGLFNSWARLDNQHSNWNRHPGSI